MCVDSGASAPDVPKGHLMRSSQWNKKSSEKAKQRRKTVLGPAAVALGVNVSVGPRINDSTSSLSPFDYLIWETLPVRRLSMLGFKPVLVVPPRLLSPVYLMLLLLHCAILPPTVARMLARLCLGMNTRWARMEIGISRLDVNPIC